MGYLKFLQDARLMNEAAEGGEAGGGATPPAKPAEKPPEPPKAITQADIDAAVAKALATNNADRDVQEKALKDNKDSILDQLKKKKEETRDLELKQRMMDGDVETVTKEIEARIKKEYAEKLTESSNQVAKLEKANHNKTIEGAIDALNDVLEIRPSMKNARKLEILNTADVTTAENGDVLLDGMTPAEYGAKWLESGDTVNDWIAAKPSNGGGARGGKSPGAQSGHGVALSQFSGPDLMAEGARLQKLHKS